MSSLPVGCLSLLDFFGQSTPVWDSDYDYGFVLYSVLSACSELFKMTEGLLTDASDSTVQPVQERRPPTSSRTLKILLFTISILLLCALGAVCTLVSMYFNNMLSFNTLSEQYANAQARLLMQEHNAIEMRKKYEVLEEKYQKSHDRTSWCNECYKCGLCEEGWTAFNVKCYYFSTVKLSWNNSRDHCVDKGGHMVIITSQSEQVFVSSNVKETHWIGLNDLETEGKWMWVNSEPLNNVIFWHKRANTPNEPDNWKTENPSGENCASLGNEGGSTDDWFDSDCRKLKKIICEIPRFKLPCFAKCYAN